MGYNEGMGWNKANVLARRVGRTAFLFVIVMTSFALGAVNDALSDSHYEILQAAQQGDADAQKLSWCDV